MSIETLSEHRCFAGRMGYYRHFSQTIGLPMRFSVYQPPQAAHGPVPVLYYLAGLTCTEETFMVKAGAQRLAAELGLMLVSCDTSPRATGIAGEADDWEFGAGAGFYLNATQAPWSAHFRMYDYVRDELRAVVGAHFPASPLCSISGHSMGGHGALVLGLRNPQIYCSVSAFAPICAAQHSAWGRKALPRYLGSDTGEWAAYDACAVVRSGSGPLFPMLLVDQGLDDKFLHAGQLQPEALEAACAERGQPLQLRRHPGYDHGYYFIASFIDDHLRFHAEALAAAC